MSHVETHIGKLRKVDTRGLSTKEWCIDVIFRKTSSFYEDGDWKDDFLNVDKNWKKYTFYGDELYETFEHKELDSDSDIDILTDNGDGTYDFIMQFYNGGTCLQECLEYGLKRLKK